MKTIISILSVLVFFSLPGMAQSGKTSYDITKDQFNLNIKVGKNNSYKLQSIKSSKGKKIRAELYDLKDLASLKLKPGSEISGRFRFSKFATEGGLGTTRVNEFASAGGLGTTRVISGRGTGTFKLSKVKGPDRKTVGCPPLCKKSVKLGLKIGK